MALVKCPECGKEISDKAISCPGCGVPNKKTETNRYQLSVPHYEYKSTSGSYLRFCGYAVWVLGGIASIVLSLKFNMYGEVVGFNFWMFLLLAVVFFVGGLVPFGFAKFFDDVHTIRCTLQGMSLTQVAQQGKAYVVNDKYVCTKCGAQYAKFYAACPKCGQER